jgi:hypothetical protein
MIDLGWLAGPSAIVAAVATVVGAVTLILFFAKGQPWGTINDVSSIVLMLATIPVALSIPAPPASWLRDWQGGIAAVGIVGMVGAAVAQGLLVARVATYERLLPWTLGFGAVVGVWYLLVGFAGIGSSLFFETDLIRLETLAIASGISFIALGYGFLRGNERHPLSVIGGLVLVVTSTWFLAWIGLEFISGDIYLA